MKASEIAPSIRHVARIQKELLSHASGDDAANSNLLRQLLDGAYLVKFMSADIAKRFEVRVRNATTMFASVPSYVSCVFDPALSSLWRASD